MDPQEKEHKVDPGGIFCIIGMCFCVVLGLTIDIIISRDNKANTEKSSAPAPLPPPPNTTQETFNISETTTPIPIAGNSSENNIETI